MNVSGIVGVPKSVHWQLIREAEVLIRDYKYREKEKGKETGRVFPLCPEHFKKNIRKFLLNCAAEVPYIANWHWAIHCLKMNWCKHAPFRYFKMVLVHPRKYSMEKIKDYVVQMKRKATFNWLLHTKGRAAAFTWANKVGYAFNGFTAEQRNKWRAGLKAENERLELSAVAAGIERRWRVLIDGSVDYFEQKRDELKEEERRRGWKD